VRAERPRTFVSFCSEDHDFVRRLIARLETLGFAPWVYQAEGRAIPPGADIRTSLTAEVRASNVFMPVITERAFGSRWVPRELELMLELVAADETLVLAPILSSAMRPSASAGWPDPFPRVVERSCFIVDFASIESVEDALFRVCEACGVSYDPLLPEDERLPFMRNFVSEVRDRVPRRAAYGVGIYQRLMGLIAAFTDAHARSDAKRMHEVATYFVQMCGYEFPGVQFYYPEVLVGYCRLRLGMDDEAEPLFLRLLEFESAEESTFLALGIIAFRRGDFASAESWFEKAVALDPGDPGSRSWLAMARSMAGKPIDLDADLIVEDDSPARFKIALCRAVALANSNRVRESIAALRGIVRDARCDADTDTSNTALLYLARYLTQLTRFGEAIEVLHEGARSERSERLLSELAAVYSDCGKLEQAARQYDDLISLFPSTRIHRVSAAQVARALGREDRVRRLCVQALDPTICGDPASREDFYLSGFANWLLGRKERAEYDFERSLYPAEQHYRFVAGS
jgi:tetratricopeptide (TPR) repeat protein